MPAAGRALIKLDEVFMGCARGRNVAIQFDEEEKKAKETKGYLLIGRLRYIRIHTVEMRLLEERDVKSSWGDGLL